MFKLNQIKFQFQYLMIYKLNFSIKTSNLTQCENIDLTLKKFLFKVRVFFKNNAKLVHYKI